MEKRQIEKIAYRSYKCRGYKTCLCTAALLDYPMDCTNCPNERFTTPRPTTIMNERIMEDALSCYRLLTAVYHLDRYYHAHDVRMDVAIEPDAPLADAFLD